MLPALEPDLKNIGEWTATAARQHAQGDHREALMNLRNAGETACRTIVRIAWPGPRGEEAVRGSTYDLLLRLIQGKALAPAEVVSALHVLRTRGNNATHGKPVTGSDSAGALFMAHTLVQHVYTGLLQRRVPQAAADGLAKAMGSATQHEQQAVLKEVLQQETRESAPPAPLVRTRPMCGACGTNKSCTATALATWRRCCGNWPSAKHNNALLWWKSWHHQRLWHPAVAVGGRGRPRAGW